MIVRVLRVIENKIATKNCFNQKPPKPPSFAYSRDSQNVLNTCMSDAYIHDFQAQFSFGNHQGTLI